MCLQVGTTRVSITLGNIHWKVMETRVDSCKHQVLTRSLEGNLHPSYLWSQAFRYRNISLRCNGSILLLHLQGTGTVNCHLFQCWHWLQKAIAQIIKYHTGQFEMWNPQWICKIYGLRPFPHTQTLMMNPHLLRSSFIPLNGNVCQVLIKIREILVQFGKQLKWKPSDSSVAMTTLYTMHRVIESHHWCHR